jgi:hypothetical protein
LAVGFLKHHPLLEPEPGILSDSEIRTLGMKSVTILSGCMLLAFCASDARQPPPNRVSITAENAVRVAKRELSRRKLLLPSGYNTRVVDTFFFAESGPNRRLFVVSFGTGTGSSRVTLYEVAIDPRSGVVDNVSDFVGARE